ncbi:MAG TPA: glucoamylase family protein [Candidatus Acidoferrum sp.]|nr:glucoamylase family protein [Candidatus Acidoferrum sp.]
MSRRRSLTRRKWLQDAGLLGAAAPLALPSAVEAFQAVQAQEPDKQALEPREPTPGLPARLFSFDPSLYRFTPDEDTFLEEVGQTSFQYFWEQANPKTGQVEDRGAADGGTLRNASSVAATGFGLTILCIAAKRDWLEEDAVRDRVKITLNFALKTVQHQHGFLYHFVNSETGQRILQSEISPMDTCLLLCGALTCRAFFDDKEIKQLATEIYERVDWTWMLHNGQTLAMGWMPEQGFLKTRWDSYSELMMMYLLGMGSPTHPLPATVWNSWQRPQFEFDQIAYIGAHAPIFAHQFSHAWFNFRGIHDKYGDYFANSIVATKVHKIWCLELSDRFPDYSENLWGVSASDSEHGYTAWGGPPTMGRVDGSIVPCAAAGSLPFLPKECVSVLQNIREKYEKRAWKKYGYVDAFNPLNNWGSLDVVGIDAGITVVMAENARTGFVWEQFAKNPEVKKGLDMAGFQPNGKS